MTLDDINAIDDYTLRNIRLKYWHLKHKAFIDEQGTPDHLLGKVWDELTLKEEQEVAEYLSGKTTS